MPLKSGLQATKVIENSTIDTLHMWFPRDQNTDPCLFLGLAFGCPQGMPPKCKKMDERHRGTTMQNFMKTGSALRINS